LEIVTSRPGRVLLVRRKLHDDLGRLRSIREPFAVQARYRIGDP
jgi:hypothetical protein